MAEVVAERSEAIAPAVACANDRLWANLISQTDARSKVMPVHVLVTMIRREANTENFHVAGVDVQLGTIACLRLPSQGTPTPNGAHR